MTFRHLIVTLAALSALSLRAEEPVRFAFITDNHYSAGSRSITDLRRCIRDINSREDLDFVIMGGDITDFGSDDELAAVKVMLDSLSLDYYVVPGNHDAKWSESGCNTFRKVFGYEQFAFEKKGWRFLGCSCGPDMRMAPALLPQESMEWLRSLEGGKKSIFINHYPQDTSVLNYFDVTKELKRVGVQFEIGGHWHRNTALNYEGIPAVLGRSSMTDRSKPAGYNVFTVFEDSVTVAERRLFPHSTVLMEPWYTAKLGPVRDTVTYDSDGLPADYPWMRYDVNKKYPSVKELWKIRERANVVAGFASDGRAVYYTTASGMVKAVSIDDGHEIWAKQFPGKIFSTPALEGKYLVFGCTDGKVYALNAKNGKTLWSHKADKSIVASPVIFDKKVFIGSSDGVFRALSLKKGKLIWAFDKVEGFVECRPFVDDEQVVFGTWANRLYSLDPRTGALQWVWQCKKPSRMYSPAAVWPVKSEGKIFIAVPDRSMYAIDAATGEEVIEQPQSAREAIGLSRDGKTVYTKSMWHKLFAFNASDASLKWSAETGAGYEIGPTPIVETSRGVLYPTDKGNLLSFSSEDGSLLWAHKISIALVNPLYVVSDTSGGCKVLASTMDGVITLLQY